ncbi:MULTISPECIES: hypothetical protein [unclassified Acinetobacter]|uniref:hypothetical protein n=1 Tax=unclassified Acinetobacter TaxID=196816 RepID=UPI0015D3D142|nr:MULTISPECIES: hypothetical protein [unclassified Acinetobacter]
MEKKSLTPQLEHIARQLIRISPSLKQLYQEQMELATALNSQNIFKIEQEQHRIQLCNGLWTLQLQSRESIGYQFPRSPFRPIKIVELHSTVPCIEVVEDFLFHELYFFTGDLKPQHSLLLREKAQQFRQLILQSIFQHLNGPARVQQFLAQMTAVEAQIFDQLMQEQQIYQTPLLQTYIECQICLPHWLMQKIEQMFALHSLTEAEILPIQLLMDSLDEICFATAQFLDPTIYRIMSLSYEDRFNLQELNEHIEDIILLLDHAYERPNLLGFIRLMHRDVWAEQDILSHSNFVQATAIWQKKCGKLPLLDNNRAVRWMFKQSVEVLDWLSRNFQHSNVRVAVTALSFVDTQHIHPALILTTLQHFQFVAARLFIQNCHTIAHEHDWFNHEKNLQFVLQRKYQQHDDHRVVISPSILYLDEWLILMRQVLGAEDQAIKKVYLPLSRIMQAYLQHLVRCTQQLPQALMDYIRPETQENRQFLSMLRQHKIQLQDFRNLFYLKHANLRVSVFDAYVRDYVSATYSTGHTVPKNITWNGVFHQAVHWHAKQQKQEMLTQLKRKFATTVWQPFTTEDKIYFQDWVFEELKTIDRIIDESIHFKHCLASSYSASIIARVYVAFHMYHPILHVSMTLGCHVQNHILVFDQLEYSNNTQAEIEKVNIAKEFLNRFNSLK